MTHEHSHRKSEPRIRQPLTDWRWWVGFVVLFAFAFAAYWMLVRLGVDSSVAGAVAAVPMFAYALFTAAWRKRALASSRQTLPRAPEPTDPGEWRDERAAD